MELNSNLYHIIQSVYLPELFLRSRDEWICGVCISNYHIPLSSLNFYTPDEVGEVLANVLTDMIDGGELAMIRSGMSWYFRSMRKETWN